MFLTALVVQLGVPWQSGAEDVSHEEALKAREAGQIVSLATILPAMESRFQGTMVAVELERDGERWEYEIEMMTRDGQVLELTYDAATGALLETEQKDGKATHEQ